eukprot:2000183-Alexandrium_andersonii.AAC.1
MSPRPSCPARASSRTRCFLPVPREVARRARQFLHDEQLFEVTGGVYGLTCAVRVWSDTVAS